MLTPQAFDQLLHLDAGQCIQRPQWLVQQQQAGLVNQGSGQSHALLLASRERCRPFVGAVGQANRIQGLQCTLSPVTRQPKANVVDHLFPRQQPRVLEHQAGFFTGLFQRRGTRQ
ncbi:hypothetical protein D3C80_1581270 [compost metagenome]